MLFPLRTVLVAVIVFGFIPSIQGQQRIHSHKVKRGILDSFFGAAPNCRYQGVLYECTSSFRCWSSGGNSLGRCGSSWLHVCCSPRHLGGRANNQELTVFQVRQGANFISAPNYHIGSFLVYNSLDCGIQPSVLQKRVIGGKAAHFAEFPWLAHIRINDFQCGGVLISNYHVATAAHCIFRADIEDIEIHLGEYDVKNTGFFYEPLPSEVRSVTRKTVHPHFRFMTLQPDRYDIAVLHLSHPVSYRSNIAPICLPPFGATYEGQYGVVAGWGKTDNSLGRSGTHLLQKAEVPILSNDACVIWHFQKRIRLELHEEMMCAGFAEGRKDACLGDSGGPLVVKDGERWYLAGIISAGFGCGLHLQPGIYHRVSATSTWVSSVVNNQQFNYEVF